MQDCYAGDIGDFGKYGLLRWLCGMFDDDDPLSIGVLWYHFECCDGGGDVDYLKPPKNSVFECCDHDLLSILRSIVNNGERTITAIEESGALPAGTKFFSNKMVFANRKGRKAQALARTKWFEKGMRSVEDADLVFVDPNTGLKERITNKPLSAKHAYYDEMKMLWERGQSLVIYQHVRGDVKRMAGTHLQEFRNMATDPITLWWHRGTARLYFILPAPRHAKILRARIGDLLDSEWDKQGHFEQVFIE